MHFASIFLLFSVLTFLFLDDITPCTIHIYIMSTSFFSSPCVLCHCRHLLSLKHYEGDIEELDLNFTLTVEDFGQSKVVELKPGGADIPVTRENSIEYIHLVAHYKLNVQLEKQFRAFRSGLSSILPLHWLRLFNQNEFQVLISGAEIPISVSDLRRNTAYSG